jgi:hypothetical protein
MSFISRTVGSVFLSVILLAGSAFAASSGIEGTVRDAKGQPLNGADIRIETKDSGFSKVVKSDAKGHYVYSGLKSEATYRVSLLVGGAVKASINNVKAKLGESTQLNFSLQKDNAVGAKKKKATHMVYMPPSTGSNLGGRWVEVDDQGNADTVNNDNLQRTGGAAIGRMQSNSGVTKGGN